MPSRRQLQGKKELYATLNKIMTALKALAYAETRKLQRQIPPQLAIAERMRAAIAKLQQHPMADNPLNKLIIVLGTERGFCGDINRRLLDATAEIIRTTPCGVILVGDRLYRHAHADFEVLAQVTGPSVAEDVESVTDELVTLLTQHSARYPLIEVEILYYHEQEERPRRFPLFSKPMQGNSATNIAPMMYRPAQELLLELIPMYLFASLQSCLKDALLGENRKRLSHLEYATRHLQERMNALTLQTNMLRQEEIIEEIEALLFVVAD
ncbi:F0F1-type ATP synthase, gamma subunit [Hahella chejuensis KCTC 2396]|uniref:F0F1-type ATP synthase, gamma subunit n=1 Tax=Hahella chejuensis (strain KCTC 2396) TaxID=349521 RepID=Q2SNG8_HAHCH|nr:FoF1 ATP synthase subunit gamma [Hahella chejuensis]ABC27806.1 F0F1-type ATP synthase, gamma subunit [Hahella chejuensis KCTC 2396]